MLNRSFLFLLAAAALLTVSCAGPGPNRVADNTRGTCPLEDLSVVCVKDQATGLYYRPM